MYKQDLALNNLQGLICYKTQPTNLIASDGEVLVLGLWGMWSTPSLPLLPGPF